MSSELDELEKFLAKVSPKERKVLVATIEKIIIQDFLGLDIKKLAGEDNVFRVKKGVFRIIFKFTKADVKIISVERRSDTTYSL